MIKTLQNAHRYDQNVSKIFTVGGLMDDLEEHQAR